MNDILHVVQLAVIIMASVVTVSLTTIALYVAKTWGRILTIIVFLFLASAYISVAIMGLIR